LSERLQRELAVMLDAFDVARRADEQRKARMKSGELAFLAGFAALRAQVVRPIFEVAGEMLKARGHAFVIREEEFVSEPDGATREAAISLRITPSGLEGAAASDAAHRELALNTRHYNKTVSIVNGALPQSGSMAGAAGGYPLAQIDAQLVEDHVLKLVAALVRA